MIDTMRDLQLDLITNNTNKSFYHELRNSFQSCKAFYISVAFINASALGLFSKELNSFSTTKKGKIITTNYMYGTDPNALEYLNKFECIETRVYDVRNKPNGFHTKGYIFEMEDYYKIYVGSSNLTQSALKSNKEWNVSIVSKTEETKKMFLTAFDELWDESKILNDYFIETYKNEYYKRNDYKKSDLYKKIMAFIQQTEGYNFLKDLSSFTDVNEDELKEKIQAIYTEEITPNVMQEIACQNLRTFREAGENKALVISATGTGKTFMAAFDVSQFNAKKVLFVVHREKILKDALNTFKMIMPEKSMGILSGNRKELNVDYLFSTNYMIGKDEILSQFDKNHFDYVIIDEAHRSAASTYQRILNYFNPKFLLGMTATPERTDDFNIYNYFDHNVAVEYRLRDALEKKLVVPFQYYGIEDVTTDLSNINLNDTEKLAELLSVNKRVDLIIEEINKYPYNGEARHALGFCVSKKHAKYMSDEFNKRGLCSIALTAEDHEETRERVIEKLADINDPLTYVFTVGIFNEGIDIPCVNTILMLRPTESPIIFTQQLGRGLRKHKYKEFLTVLDFIGNHRKNFMLPIALYGDTTMDKDDLKKSTMNDFWDIPGDVFVRLEKQTKERILKQLETISFNKINYLKDVYQNMFNRYKNANKQAMYLPINAISTAEFDAIKFINYSKTSYFDFVQRINKNILFNKRETYESKKKYLKTIDRLLPLKNPLLYIMLQLAISHDQINDNMIIQEAKKYHYSCDKEDVRFIYEFLNHQYINHTESKRYKTLLEGSIDEIKLRKELRLFMDNDPIFNDFILSSIDYGLQRYYYEFNNVKTIDRFKLYAMYSYRDIAINIKFDKDHSSFRNSTHFYNNNFYLFVTLNKNDKSFKESTSYKDEFIDHKTFQWESPNNTAKESQTAHRIRNHLENDTNIYLFIRKNRKEDGVTQGYYFFGKMNYLSEENEKPIKFKFELLNKVPEDIFNKLKMRN